MKQLIATLLLFASLAPAATRGWQTGESTAREARFRLAVAATHACLVPYDGTVRCWGNNNFGQLGDGTTNGSPTAAVRVFADLGGIVPRLLTGAVAVATGFNDFSCALIADGRVFCWGKANGGQLGDGRDQSQPQPLAKAVPGITNAVRIAAGLNGACALLAEGTVKCWGSDFTAREIDGPVLQNGLAGAADLAMGQLFRCFAQAGGSAVCVGSNSFGELGRGVSGQTSITYAPVINLAQATALGGARNSTCAMIPQGRVQCWGRNQSGQLGNGNNQDQSAPVLVQQLNNAVAVEGGLNHLCALTAAGTAKCWGDNQDGQLGTGSNVPASVNLPVDVAGLTNLIAIAAGGDNTCAMRADGTVSCWGHRFGDQPRLIGNVGSGAVSAKSIATGTHSCAVRANGTVACWGDNGADAAILGNGSGPALVPNPTAVGGLSNASAVTVGREHSCALLANGSVKCWGRNGRGQIGNSTAVDQPLPVDVPNVREVVAIYAGAFHTCAIQVDGNTFCWGANESGQLAIQADTGDRRQPNLVLVPGIVSMGLGRAHTCAMKADGTASCWGAGANGQIGNNSFTAVNTAAQPVSGLVNGLSITAGNNHTCALTGAGQLACWGENGNGEIGQGAFTADLPAPRLVTLGLTAPPVMAAAGANHNCVAMANARVACWGFGVEGQLGLGDFRLRQAAPVVLSNFGAIAAVAAGVNTSCALATNGGPFCWGRNTEGQVGDGTTGTLLNAPVAVPSFTLNIVPTVLLSSTNPRKLTVNIVATCEEGDLLKLSVQVRQAATGAAGHGNETTRCTGGMATFPVEIQAQGGTPFAPGAATVEAEAEIRGERGERTTQQWTRAVNIAAN